MRKAKSKAWNLKKVKDSYIFQRSRIQCLREGDINSAFFHRCVNSCICSNHIDGLVVNGEWSDDVNVVKATVHDHFKN